MAVSFKNKSFKNPLQHDRLTDKDGGSRKNHCLGQAGFSTRNQDGRSGKTPQNGFPNQY